ncbi:MAG: ribosome biogenesis GTP-binding protein YihA/YsxC [Bacteroidia bacterium]|nr:ribosome biogenesis GTP-binding protein YihA/YsxC [Bacteroidia bacterium]
MEVKHARLAASSSQTSQMPPPRLPEYAFIGRSNVGKSSWINCLVRRKNLAHTSSTPGKTRVINHFLINEAWYLVDLPGYGYAKLSQTERAAFAKLLGSYFSERENLVNVFVLVDSRIPPQASDLEFMGQLGENELPFTILFTKGDKLAPLRLESQVQEYLQALAEQWEPLPPHILTSAVTGMGRETVLAQIEAWNRLFHEPPPR